MVLGFVGGSWGACRDHVSSYGVAVANYEHVIAISCPWADLLFSAGQLERNAGAALRTHRLYYPMSN